MKFRNALAKLDDSERIHFAPALHALLYEIKGPLSTFSLEMDAAQERLHLALLALGRRNLRAVAENLSMLDEICANVNDARQDLHNRVADAERAITGKTESRDD